MVPLQLPGGPELLIVFIILLIGFVALGVLGAGIYLVVRGRGETGDDERLDRLEDRLDRLEDRVDASASEDG